MSVLEAAVAEVEAGLAALTQSLLEGDSAAIDAAAGGLQRSLARALDAGSGAAPSAALRQRLARASALVAAQRDTLSRANASLERSFDALLPRRPAGYTARGTAELPPHRGVVKA